VMMHRSRKAVQAISKDFQNTETQVVGEVNDLLRGNRAVKLYAMEEQIALTFADQAGQIGRKSYERDIKSHLQWMKQESFGYLAFVALTATALWRYQQGAVTVGEISAVIIAFGALQGPMQQIFSCITLWGSAQASIERIGAVLDASSTTPDPPRDAAPVALPPAGELAFAGVSFAYADQPVLKDVSFAIPYGQRVAFVGPSGAGKSTISQLLMRLYDPDQGSVTLAGADLRRFRGQDLRRRFGVVPQDPFIFRTSIRDNVKVARPDADDESIRRALQLANAWEFVDQLPAKLDTKVGESGSTLSGGQRQRLAIARALLADTPFFIFDEATSALDTLSEDLIQHTLDTVLKGRTAIIIAHRLATVKNCDRIIVLRDGCVEQDGSYDALVAQPGLFRERSWFAIVGFTHHAARRCRRRAGRRACVRRATKPSRWRVAIPQAAVRTGCGRPYPIPRQHRLRQRRPAASRCDRSPSPAPASQSPGAWAPRFRAVSRPAPTSRTPPPGCVRRRSRSGVSLAPASPACATRQRH